MKYYRRRLKKLHVKSKRGPSHRCKDSRLPSVEWSESKKDWWIGEGTFVQNLQRYYQCNFMYHIFFFTMNHHSEQIQVCQQKCKKKHIHPIRKGFSLVGENPVNKKKYEKISRILKSQRCVIPLCFGNEPTAGGNDGNSQPSNGNGKTEPCLGDEMEDVSVSNW